MKTIILSILIFSFIAILSIVGMIIYKKTSKKHNYNFNLRKVSIVYACIFIVIVGINFYMEDKANKQKLLWEQNQKKIHLEAQNSKNSKYVTLLESGKTYEQMDEQQRANITEILANWDKQDQEFKGKYKSEKEFIEKSKVEAVAKWKAEKEAKDTQVAAQKAEEEKVAYDTGITYDQLARTPDNYIGKKVKFSGKVVQVIDGDNETSLRIAIDGNYKNILFVAYKSNITSTRILEDDYVTVSGKSSGIYKYKSTIGGQISIPSMLVDKIELNK